MIPIHSSIQEVGRPLKPSLWPHLWMHLYPHTILRISLLHSPLGGQQGNLLLVLVPSCCSASPNKTLHELLVYPLINFYAVVVLCVNSTYILSPTTTINVILNGIHSDSPPHAPTSSWRTVLTSKTIFLPEVLLLVFLLTEVCWVLVLCRCLSPAFIFEAVFSGCVAQRAGMLSLHAWGLVSWPRLCCCVS